MNILDIGIVLIFVMFLISGFKKGVIRELASLIGIIIVFVIAFSLKGLIGNLLCTFLPFFKFTGSIAGISALNILIYQVIAFLIVFSVLLGLYGLVLKVSSIFQKLVNMTIVLWLPSKLLGAVVSFISGYIMIFIIAFILMVPLKNQPLYSESVIINHMIYNSPILSKRASTYTKTIEEVYGLGFKVSKKDIDAKDANLEAIDIMLKYDVVDKGTIERLISLNKMENVENVDKVLSKY